MKSKAKKKRNQNSFLLFLKIFYSINCLKSSKLLNDWYTEANLTYTTGSISLKEARISSQILVLKTSDPSDCHLTSKLLIKASITSGWTDLFANASITAFLSLALSYISFVQSFLITTSSTFPILSKVVYLCPHLSHSLLLLITPHSSIILESTTFESILLHFGHFIFKYLTD